MNADLNRRFERTTENGGPDLPSLFVCEALLATFFSIWSRWSFPFSVCGFHPRPFPKFKRGRRGEEQRGGRSALLRHTIKRNPSIQKYGNAAGTGRERERSPVSLELTKRHRPTPGLSFVSQSNHRLFCLCGCPNPNPTPHERGARTQNWENFPFSLSVSPIPRLFWAPLCVILH